MAGLGSKKDIAKRDLNFFAEFTAAAAKMTRLLGYGVVVGIVVVAIIVGFIVWGIIRNAITQSAINDLEALLASDEYAGLQEDAVRLNSELTGFNNYYYALSQMREQVDKIPAVPVELTNIMEKSIPSDSYIDKYEISQTGMHVEGYTFSYYSALNFVNLLNKSDVFSLPVQLEVQRVDPSTIGSVETFIRQDGRVNAINNYYHFIVEGLLVSEVHVSVSNYLRTPDGKGGFVISSLGGVEVEKYKAGSTYEVNNIATYEQSGVTYNLSQVAINRATLAQDKVTQLATDNKISGIANDDIEIQLYYSPAEENKEGQA